MLFHKNKNRNFYWQIHDAGLVNQIMCLEMGSGIAFMEECPITFYEYKRYEKPIFTASRVHSKREKLTNSKNPNLFDVMNVPSELNYSLLPFFNEKKVFNIKNNIRFYYKCQDGEHEKEFAEGRERLDPDKDKKICFNTNNLAFYSRFFFNRTKELDLFFSKLTFKSEYFEFVEKVANDIGKFSAIHFRLTDHARNYASTSENRIKYFEKLQNKGLPVIVSTDDNELIKKEIDGNYILVDDIICDYFPSDFLKLPFHDEVVFGLISMLMLANSEYFIGTPGSTFSAYIHRLRFNNNKPECFEYMPGRDKYDNYVQNGPFSWNGFDCHTNVKNWWREWPECKLRV